MDDRERILLRGHRRGRSERSQWMDVLRSVLGSTGPGFGLPSLRLHATASRTRCSGQSSGCCALRLWCSAALYQLPTKPWRLSQIQASGGIIPDAAWVTFEMSTMRK